MRRGPQGSRYHRPDLPSLYPRSTGSLPRDIGVEGVLLELGSDHVFRPVENLVLLDTLGRIRQRSLPTVASKGRLEVSSLLDDPRSLNRYCLSVLIAIVEICYPKYDRFQFHVENYFLQRSHSQFHLLPGFAWHRKDRAISDQHHSKMKRSSISLSWRHLVGDPHDVSDCRRIRAISQSLQQHVCWSVVVEEGAKSHRYRIFGGSSGLDRLPKR
jgi:hypothetical protein